MWLRTVDGWYVHELRGVCFITWVSVEDKAHAGIFPEENIDDWVSVVSKMSGKFIEKVKPF